MKSAPRLLALLALLALLVASSASSHAAYTLVNGSFEDTSDPFPTGWTTTGTVDANAAGGFGSGNPTSAFLNPSGNTPSSITQDFSGGSTFGTDENYNLQLDWAFRTSALSTTTDQRFRFRDNNNSDDRITLGFESAATAGGLALSYFTSGGGGWQPAVDQTISVGTTWYFRLNVYDFDQASRYYTLGVSTDGINYTTGPNLSGFHGATGDIESFRIESGSSQVRVDSISVIPEPAVAFLGGLGLLGLLRRRR